MDKEAIGIGNIFTLVTFAMSLNHRILLNIFAAYGRSLYALIIGLFCGWWVLAALGKSEPGLYGVVGGITVIVMLAYTMRLLRGGIAAVGNEHYCGNLLW